MDGRSKHDFSSNQSGGRIAYEPTFLEAISAALKDITKYKIKVAVNAGSFNTLFLYTEPQKLMNQQDLAGELKLAWISGDNVLAHHSI